MSFGKSWRQERPMGEEVKWQESVVDAGKAPCWHCANGSRGQWQSPHHLSLQIPAEQERSSNGVLQMSDPEPPTCRVATSCHPALVFVPPKTVCVQETNAGVLGLARPEDNEGWLYPRRIEDGRCLLHPLRWCQYCLLILENTSNIPSVFSMHDALYSSVDWLLTGPDAGCIPLQWPCHAPTTSSRIAENLQEASTHLCTPPKNFSASSLRFREDERGANSGRGLERKNIRPEDPGEDPLTPHILYPTPRQLRTIYHFQINSLNFKPNPSFIIALLDSLDFSSQPCVKMSSSTSSSPTSPTWTTPTPTSTTTTTTTSTWQRKLQEACEARGIVGVKFELKSDMRGGRTAWAAEVVFKGMRIHGRYWFEGDFNAKEDAAEVALGVLLVQRPLPQHPQIFPQTQQVVPYPMQFGTSRYATAQFPVASQPH